MPRSLDANHNSAEAIGVCWAVLFALSLPPRIPVTIVSDSDITLGSATGNYINKACRDGQHLLMPLVRALESQRQLKLEHIHSHIGHPWNELADGLARLASFGAIQRAPRHRASPLTLSPALEWLWLIWSPQAGAYPPVDADGHFEVDTNPTEASAQVFDNLRATAFSFDEDEIVGMSLMFMTTNVQTLDHTREGLNPPGHRSQFLWKGRHFATGLQRCRCTLSWHVRGQNEAGHVSH